MQRLYVFLSEILDTKRETRGFIVNLGDVLFDRGRATLKWTWRRIAAFRESQESRITA